MSRHRSCQNPTAETEAKKRAGFAKARTARKQIMAQIKRMNSYPGCPVHTLGYINPKWGWHYRTLLALRQQLLFAQAEHQQTASATTDLHGLDAAEVAQEESEHEVILAELHAEEDRLAEVNDALQRLRDGTYGICEETGAPISAARLRAIPWARFCRSSAQRREAQQHLVSI